MDGNRFTISKGIKGAPVKVNGFPISEGEYQKALNGETVTISADGKTATLAVTDGSVTINGKSLNVGNNISMIL